MSLFLPRVLSFRCRPIACSTCFSTAAPGLQTSQLLGPFMTWTVQPRITDDKEENPHQEYQEPAVPAALILASAGCVAKKCYHSRAYRSCIISGIPNNPRRITIPLEDGRDCGGRGYQPLREREVGNTTKLEVATLLDHNLWSRTPDPWDLNTRTRVSTAHAYSFPPQFDPHPHSIHTPIRSRPSALL